MKRKIFSKLLMGAFLIASVSSFVSCKDYDDDINNLQKQIDAAALKAELTSLQSTLQAQIAAAQSAADKAAAAAQAAQNTANAAATKDALAAVQSAAEKAGADAATAITAASQAQIAASAAQASADAAQSTANNAATKDALEVVKAAAEAAQNTANNAATKDALAAVQTAAEKAAADAAKSIADAAAAAQKAADAAQAAQSTASVAQTAAAAAAEAAKVAQNAGDAATATAKDALADAAKALTEAAAASKAAEAAQSTAPAAQNAANAADASATEAKATAANGVAAAGNAAAQAAAALAAASAAQKAAAEAKYNDEAVRILIDKAQGSADAAAKDAKDAAEAAAAAVLASAAAGDDAAAAKAAAAKVDEAIATATAAISEATDAKIQAAVAEAMAKVPADTTAEIEKLSGDLQTLGSTVEKLATAEGLSAAVTALEGQIGGVADAAAAAAVAAAAGTIEAAVAELYATVTSVELVGSFSALDFNPDKDSQTYPLGFTTSTWAGIDLDFIFGKQQWTATFGDKETESLDDDAVEKVSYKKGDDIRANRALLIRVNPVNAEFTKDQVKFINSKLETLDEIVEIGEPYRFKGMLTRGTSESGLWVIPVNVKKDVTFNKFNEITFYKSAGDWKYDKSTGDLETWRYDQKLYAIAIDNTPDMDGEESIDRYVASTYDIATEYVHYTPATSLSANFEWTLENVDYNQNINTIHNRWTSNVYNSENKPGILSKDQTNAYTVVPEAMEKKWTLWATNSDQYKAGLVAPTSAEPTKSIEKTVKGSKQYNTENDLSDYRFSQPYLTIKNTGDNIKVELTPALQKKVEYWYISYDFELNAVESKPSEWEAWQSYQDGIDGIYTMTRGDKAIDLQINKETAQGDVIGFRIWAVNYDGSLVDPDGKAFYVKVGEEPEANVLNISANIMAVDATTGMALTYLTDEDKTYTADKNYNVSTITPVNNNNFESLASTYGSFTGTTTIYSTGTKDQTIVNGRSVTVYWALLKSDKKTVASNYKDVAYIKAGIAGSDLKNLKDGATLSNIVTYTDTRKDVNNKEKYTIKISVTKQMPDDAWTKKYIFDGVITWKTDYGWDPTSNVLTTYVKPYYDLVPQGFDYLKPKFIKGTGGAADVFNWKWQAGATTADVMSGWIDDAKWLNWDYSVNTNLANAGVRDIDDYIASVKAGTDLSLYKWVIEGAPTELTGTGEPATKDYTALWTSGTADKDVADNAIVAVKAKAVREDQTLNSKLKYTYVGISARIKAVATDGTVTWEGWDLVKNANDFKTHFADAMDLLTYDTQRSYLAYDVWQEQGTGGTLPAIKTGSKNLTDNNLYIDWKGTVTGQNWITQVQDVDVLIPVLFQLNLTDNREAAVGTIASQAFNPNTYQKFNSAALAGSLISSNLTSFLRATISAPNRVLAENKQISGSENVNGAGIDRDRVIDGTTTSANPNINKANRFAFDENYYRFDNPNRKATDPVVTAMKIELSGAITTYLKVSPNATPSNMIFQKIGGVQDPHQNVSGNIKLSGYDVFGKYHEFNLPVVILYNN